MFTFVTSNPQKAEAALRELAPFGLHPTITSLEVEEVQADTIETVAIRKAQEAYAKLQIPLVISDHGWEFPALNGFPGPYMKYINQWFTPEDLLALFAGKTDRRAILHEVLVFYDGSTQEVFVEDSPGVILSAPEGQGLVGQQLISLSNDGHSIAWHREHGSIPRPTTAWSALAKWYLEQTTVSRLVAMDQPS